jgi:hypothetical protein
VLVRLCAAGAAVLPARWRLEWQRFEGRWRRVGAIDCDRDEVRLAIGEAGPVLLLASVGGDPAARPPLCSLRVVVGLAREFWAFPEPASGAGRSARDKRDKWERWKSYICDREKRADPAFDFDQARRAAGRDAEAHRAEVKRRLDGLVEAEKRDGRLRDLSPEARDVCDAFNSAYLRALERALTYDPSRGDDFAAWFEAIYADCRYRRDPGRAAWRQAPPGEGQDFFAAAPERPQAAPDPRPLADVVERVERMLRARVCPPLHDLEAVAAERLRRQGVAEPTPTQIDAEVSALTAGRNFHTADSRVSRAARMAELRVLAEQQRRTAEAMAPGADGREVVARSAGIMAEFVAHQSQSDHGRKLKPTVARFDELQTCWRQLRRRLYRK